MDYTHVFTSITVDTKVKAENLLTDSDLKPSAAINALLTEVVATKSIPLKLSLKGYQPGSIDLSEQNITKVGFKVPTDLRVQAHKVLDALGMPVGTLIRVFYLQIIRDQEIPKFAYTRYEDTV